VTPTALEVIIVTATGCRSYIEPCLRSLRAHAPTGAAIAVHVVDNASADGTPELIRARHPEVELVEMGRNAGFAAASNRALAVATAPYVLLLNPDTELRPGVLDALLSRMEGEPGIGALGCRLVGLDGKPDFNAKRSVPTPSKALLHFAAAATGIQALARRARYRTPELGWEATGPVDAVSGAFMLVRTSALGDVGLLDPGYWMYGEDLDWCQRFRERGWQVVYDGGHTVLHVKGGATGRHRRLRQNVAFHRSMGRFYRKFQGGRHAHLDLLVYTGIGARLLGSVTVSAFRRRARAR
jgi:GT2 family glycosyltransferase